MFAFHLQAKKSLGQHFLRDERVVARIVSSLEDLVYTPVRQCVEIGPGSGILTQRLLKNGWNVTAIERDERAVDGPKDTLAKDFSGHLHIITSDVLKWIPPPSMEPKWCIGNVPYYITSDIFLWFLANKSKFHGGIFMIQDEVADRLVATPGNKDYGRLSIRLQLAFHIEKLFIVPADAFVPPPKVQSAVVRLTPLESCPLLESEERGFESFTQVLFSARRKMLRRILGASLPEYWKDKADLFWQEALKLGITPESRPDIFSPEVLLSFFRLWKKSS